MLAIKKKRLTRDHASSPKPIAPNRVKVPKISVPTFDDDILNWSTFWDQCNTAIHNSTQLSD